MRADCNLHIKAPILYSCYHFDYIGDLRSDHIVRQVDLNSDILFATGLGYCIPCVLCIISITFWCALTWWYCKQAGIAILFTIGFRYCYSFHDWIWILLFFGRLDLDIAILWTIVFRYCYSLDDWIWILLFFGQLDLDIAILWTIGFRYCYSLDDCI